ncbi:HAD family phosphatase [Candidatus Woesearchaeota archaeon]|nr:HAD family phosphatase [Candidatus Woesearchaeota archaeon]
MGTITAILFDLDGVLIDSEKAHHLAEKKSLTQQGYGSFHPAVGMPFGDQIAAINQREHLTLDRETAMRDKDALMLQGVDKIHIFPEAAAIVAQLSLTYRLALVTGASKPFTLAVLRHLHLNQYFDALVTAEDVQRGKPFPDPYLRAVDLLGKKPEACVVVEDSLFGISSAKAAGTMCIALTTSFPKHLLTQADMVIDNLTELPEAIKTLENQDHDTKTLRH